MWTDKFFSSAQKGKNYTNTQDLPISFTSYQSNWANANTHNILVNGYGLSSTGEALSYIPFGLHCIADITNFTVYLFAVGH